MSEQTPLLRKLDDTGVPLLLARLVLGGMFIYMGGNKLFDPINFMKMIHEYEMMPDNFYVILNLIAATLPWIEVLCGVLLVAGVLLRGSSFVLMAMLTGFTFAVIWRAIHIHSGGGIAFCDIKFDCGCGAGEEWICHKVPKNVGMWLLCWVVLLSRSQRFCVLPRIGGRRQEVAVGAE